MSHGATMYDPITFGFTSKWSCWYQMKAHIFSHYACKIVRVKDVACKSYERKRSESLEIVVNTIFEILKSKSLCRKI